MRHMPNSSNGREGAIGPADLGGQQGFRAYRPLFRVFLL